MATRNNLLAHQWSTGSLLILIVYVLILNQGISSSSQGLSTARVAARQHQYDSDQNNHHQQQSSREKIAYSYKIIIPDLPVHQYQFWLRNHPKARSEFEKVCNETSQRPEILENEREFEEVHSNLYFENKMYSQDLAVGVPILEQICSKINLADKSCWGYENGCELLHVMPECIGDNDLVNEEKISWFTQADFGHVHDLREQLQRYCNPERKLLNDNVRNISLFECTNHFRTCRGQNLFLELNLTSNNFSQGGPFKPGYVGGWACDLQQKLIKKQEGHTGHLESWYNELEDYQLVVNGEPCDDYQDKPTFFIKTDSPSDMYDYISIFINLYETMHFNNRFSDDNQIIVWDITPIDPRFVSILSAFSRNPPTDLNHLKGKKVCFAKFFFSLTPRQIDGLMHHDELISAMCKKSGLIDAFSKHVLHRLHVTNHETKPDPQTLRVIIMSRPKKQHRAISNEKEFIREIEKLSDQYIVSTLDYESSNFLDSLVQVHSSDLMIGAHSDGLTYSLFSPDYASVLEVNKCGSDKFENLVRMRGLNYYSAHKKPESSTELKQPCEYKVDIKEFLILFERISKETLERKAEHFKTLSSSTQFPKTTTTEKPATTTTTTTKKPATTTTTTTEKPATITTTTTKKPATTTTTTTTTKKPATISTTTTEKPATISTTTTEKPATISTTTTEKPATISTTTTENPTTPTTQTPTRSEL